MPTDSGLNDSALDAVLAAAHASVREGRMVEAAEAFHAVLAARPEHKEALRFFARTAMARGAAGDAVDWLNRAAAADRNDVGVLLELGVAYRVAERFDASRYIFERALELGQGRNVTARLLLANVLELDQRQDVALTHYFRAILDAQQNGQWLDDESTQPALRDLVRHAMAFVFEGRRALFSGVVQPMRDRADAAAMERIERALAIYLRESDEGPQDPLQRPGIIYVPGLGSERVLANDRLAWLPTFAGAVASLGEEIRSLLAGQGAGEEPQDAALSGSDIAAAECRVAVYRRGVPTGVAMRAAPTLLAALADTPLASVRDHSPDVEILSLAPGQQMATPCGRSNARCRVLLALPGSVDVEVRLGGQSHALGAAGALVVDSSFAMETINRGYTDARVLAFEIWHHDLSPDERDALTALTAAIVEFDSRLELA